MWYPAKVTVAAASEPLTLDEAKRQVNALDFDDDDAAFTAYIATARDHIEQYCNTRLASQTIDVKCDGFADFARFPEAPVASITSITYVDVEGTTQMLDDTIYELRADGLEASIALKYAQYWPAIQHGSRITVTAVVGYDVAPAAVKHAMLLWISDAYYNRENSTMDDWTAFDSLLCNFRRGT